MSPIENPVYKEYEIPLNFHRTMGLTDDEYLLILGLMKRNPTLTELGMFAVMWSEHCGYKYSRKILETFKKYKQAVEGDGLENAGIVDIGNGLGITFKVESHNHPSAVEPYQGAATGVGGIIRDIFTMGARPIALLNSLRFGPIVDGEAPPEVVERNRYLVEHVVAGIAGYGNCVGVPTVGGEINFHPLYSGNPLVNAMCVGLVKLDEVTTAGASGEGNLVVYLGSSTGKDGIHGATFASDDLNEESESKRPNVQIGDPFAEKLLIEATLEALQTGAIVAIQDMGAAGITCSTIEMTSKGGVGMEVDLDLVPMRENDMTAYELMLSESQERMLAVVSPSRIDEVLVVFEKWGLPARVIGKVTSERLVKVYRNGKLEASIDPWWLTEECPFYENDLIIPQEVLLAKEFDEASLAKIDIKESLEKLLSHPEIANKQWVYRQYDRQVLTQTLFASGQSDAAVIVPRGSDCAIAVTIDGNSRHTRLNPYIGGWNAVHEAARNIACSGAVPVASTDGLNFGNPQNPEVYWQLKEAVLGIAEAAEAVNAPVVSGNVSLYNRSDLGEIPPTPLIGMAGVLKSIQHAIPSSPSHDLALGAKILLLKSETVGSGLGGSAFLNFVLGIDDGVPIQAHESGEKKLRNFFAGINPGDILSAHDVSDGGLLVTLVETLLPTGFGATFSLNDVPNEMGAVFGERPGEVLICVEESNLAKIKSYCLEIGIEFEESGVIDGSELILRLNKREISWKMSDLKALNEKSFAFHIEKSV